MEGFLRSEPKGVWVGARDQAVWKRARQFVTTSFHARANRSPLESWFVGLPHRHLTHLPISQAPALGSHLSRAAHVY